MTWVGIIIIIKKLLSYVTFNIMVNSLIWREQNNSYNSPNLLTVMVTTFLTHEKTKDSFRVSIGSQ